MRFDLNELWLEVRGHRISPPALRGHAPAEEDPELLTGESICFDDPPAVALPLHSIAGILIEISYRDSKGCCSQRRITCRRLERRGAVDYVFAYCHERNAVRQFRCDRVEQVIDTETGEVWETPGLFFCEYVYNLERAGPATWGLPVQRYVELRSALIVLAFMARCDSEWHHLETAEIERFITSYWLREEIAAELRVDDILKDIGRLAPLAEDFFVALERCAASERISPLIRRAISNVVAADGIIRDQEFFWGDKVDSFLGRI